jgi:hypothetical protein
MLANDAPINVPARSVEPYLHADNRGLVVFDGRRCVVLPAQTLPWVAETIGILLEEKRATRHHGTVNCGGFIDDNGQSATLYVGPAEDMATLRVSVDSVAQLRDALTRR